MSSSKQFNFDNIHPEQQCTNYDTKQFDTLKEQHENGEEVLILGVAISNILIVILCILYFSVLFLIIKYRNR